MIAFGPRIARSASITPASGSRAVGCSVIGTCHWMTVGSRPSAGGRPPVGTVIRQRRLPRVIGTMVPARYFSVPSERSRSSLRTSQCTSTGAFFSRARIAGSSSRNGRGVFGSGCEASGAMSSR